VVVGLRAPRRSGCLSPEPRLPNITPSKQNKNPQNHFHPPSHQTGQAFHRVTGLAFFGLDSKSWTHWRPQHPLFAQQGSHISIHSSAPHTEQLGCTPGKCKGLLQGKKVGHSLHHFSWFEAPILSGLICLVGAFISAAVRLRHKV